MLSYTANMALILSTKIDSIKIHGFHKSSRVHVYWPKGFSIYNTTRYQFT